MIRLRNIEKAIKQGAGQIFLLRRIDLEIAAGEFVTVMGPSGAGKSTLLAIVGLLDHAWTGEYELFGEQALWEYKRGAARAALGRTKDAEDDLRDALRAEARKWVYGRAHLELGKLALKAGNHPAARWINSRASSGRLSFSRENAS